MTVQECHFLYNSIQFNIVVVGIYDTLLHAKKKNKKQFMPYLPIFLPSMVRFYVNVFFSQQILPMVCTTSFSNGLKAGDE